MRTIFWILAATLVLVPSVRAQDNDQEYADKILYIGDDGSSQSLDKVKVTQATYEKVTYQTRGGRSTGEKDGSLVTAIIWGDAPRVYSEGLDALSKGQYEQAMSDLEGAKNAVSVGKARDWLTEYARVYKGQALVGLALTQPTRAAEAVTELRSAVEANGKSLLYPQIQLGLATAYRLDKKYDEAKNAAQALVDVGQQTKQPVWQTQGQQALADTLAAQGRYADAVNAYRDLVLLAQRELRFVKNESWKRALERAETTAAVEQGWARVAWAETNPSEWDNVRKHFEGLASQYPGNDLVEAAVLNGVGRVLLETDPWSALMKFTEAEVKHFTARTEVARSLYLKAKALDKLGRHEKAEKARREIQTFYKDSEWAKK